MTKSTTDEPPNTSGKSRGGAVNRLFYGDNLPLESAVRYEVSFQNDTMIIDLTKTGRPAATGKRRKIAPKGLTNGQGSPADTTAATRSPEDATSG